MGGDWECEYVSVNAEGMNERVFKVGQTFKADSAVVHKVPNFANFIFWKSLNQNIAFLSHFKGF